MPKVRSNHLGTCRVCESSLTDCRDRKTGKFGVCCSYEDCRLFAYMLPGRESNYAAVEGKSEVA